MFGGFGQDFSVKPTCKKHVEGRGAIQKDEQKGKVMRAELMVQTQRQEVCALRR